MKTYVHTKHIFKCLQQHFPKGGNSQKEETAQMPWDEWRTDWNISVQWYIFNYKKEQSTDTCYNVGET